MEISGRTFAVAAQKMTASALFLKSGQPRSLLSAFFVLILLFAAQTRTHAQTLENFDPNVTGLFTVYSMSTQPDGKIVIGGAFSAVGGATRNNLARLNADGTLDTSLNANPNSTIFTTAVQPDGKFYAGGGFTTIAGQTQSRLARFNADGTLDTGFQPNPDGSPRAIAIQPDGKILVGGSFTTIAGAPRTRIARLNQDGSLDAGFSASADGSVNSFALQPDGKIIIGGESINFVNGQPRTRVARLNANGTLDESFVNPNITGTIYGVLRQPDGKVLISGNTSNLTVGGLPRTGLARLNADGTVDASFNPVFTAANNGTALLLSLAQQADGKIFVSGSFVTVNGQNYTNLVRLNTDGSIDASFAALTFTAFSSVHTLLQPDGKLVLSGSFNTVNGQTRNRMARITNPTPATQSLEITPQSILLRRGGSAPELSLVTFERSATNINYVFLGNAVRFGTSSDWILYAANLPTGANFIRARGYYATSYFNGSTSITETVGNITLNARTAFDFDGDGKADVSVFRPSDNTWYILRSQAGFSSTQWGLSTDRLAPADYDGDGKTDIAVFRDGAWYILQSSNNSFRTAALGAAGDAPLPADYDADGRAELAVFRPSNGTWYTQNLTSGQALAIRWGGATDKPIAGDFDGDGRADFTVNRDGVWYILRLTGVTTTVYFGLPTDKSVAADYDGDRITDIAVFRDGNWFYRSSSIGNQLRSFQFGQTGDIPVPADYDGDGKADFAVYRNGTWFAQNSTAGFSSIGFGLGTDAPVPATYIP